MLFLGGKRKKKKQRQRQRQLNQSLRPPGYAPAFGSAVAFGPACCGTASDRVLKRGGSGFARCCIYGVACGLRVHGEYGLVEIHPTLATMRLSRTWGTRILNSPQGLCYSTCWR